MASTRDRAALWGDLAACYLGEVAAAGIYEQAMRHLADPEAHARLAAWLEAERRRTRGLRGHLASVGPPLPEALVGLVRDVARLVGGAAALRGPDAAVELAQGVGKVGAARLGPIADRYPAGSVEAERYRAFEAEGGDIGAWLAAWRTERAQDGLVGQVEAIEHASIVEAPIGVVFETLTAIGHQAALLGLPLSSPDGVERLGEDLRYRLRVGVGPLAFSADAHVVAWDPPGFWVVRLAGVPFDRWEHHHRLEPLGPGRTLVADRLLVRPRMLPPPPESLQPSPWKLALQLGLWAWHDRLAAYLRNP
jgi:hypothetical protein